MWHPVYPRWSKSCYKGDTTEEAWESLDACGGEPCYAILMVEERKHENMTEFRIVGSRMPTKLSGWNEDHVKRCRENDEKEMLT